jgi:hypothetical protein
MALRCPVCKAENATGPACRRCKADLSLVFALEEQREFAMQKARHALTSGRYGEAHRAALAADHLRRDEASRRLVALTALMCRDHALAWRERGEGRKSV